MNETPLFTAVSFNRIENVQSLIKANVNVNARSSKGTTPLHVATKYGYFEISQILVNNGAEVNAQDEQKISPLHFATLQKNGDLVQFLLDNGADPLLRNISGKSPFSLANSEISEILRQAVAERTQQKSQEMLRQREEERSAKQAQEQNPIEEEEDAHQQNHEEETKNDQYLEQPPENQEQPQEGQEQTQEEQESKERENHEEEEENIQMSASKPVPNQFTPSRSRSSSRCSSSLRKKAPVYEDMPITNQAKYEFQEFEREVQDELISFKSDVDKQIKELMAILMDTRREFLKSKRGENTGLPPTTY